MLTDAEKRRLTPEDLLLEERAELRIKKARFEDDEAYRDQCAAEEALETNPDIDLDRAIIRGKRVNGRNSFRRSSEAHAGGMTYRELLAAAGGGKTFQEFLDTCKSLANMFDGALAAGYATGAATKEKQLVQTDIHEFDFIFVSTKTKEMLEAEASALNTRVLALAAIKEPGARRVEIENIQKEAERLHMVQHPETMLYVHSEARVIALELIHNPLADAKLCTHTVCVFRLRPQGVDSLGIRSKVADVLDQNPQELRVSGDHIKPELKYS